MRVLYLCAIAGIGGAERSLLDLLGRLPRDQVTPVLLVPAAGALSHEAARLGIQTEVVSWPGAITALGRERHVMNRLRLLTVPFLLPPFVLRLTMKIRALGADLVHTNGTRAHLAGALACLMAREGSTARNLAALLPVVQRLGTRRALLVTDDRTPTDLRDQGHLDHVVREATRLGLDPVAAVTMASLNAAERFGLKRLGAVAPGYRADLVVSDNLADFRARLVLKGGHVVARDGRLLFEPPYVAYRRPLS